MTGHVHLFAGPTLARARAMAPDLVLDGIAVHAPVRRGDVPRITAETAPGAAGRCLLVVDGYFHDALAVGHAELRQALADGWQVWGLSSIGAIRARELADLGMRGYGEVHALYAGAGDFRDDEVALLHAMEPPWQELSEPLVHLRRALAELTARGLLDEAQGAAVLDALCAMWFGDRTLGRFLALLVAAARGRAAELRAALADFDRYRVKCHDLIRFLRERPW